MSQIFTPNRQRPFNLFDIYRNFPLTANANPQQFIVAVDPYSNNVYRAYVARDLVSTNNGNIDSIIISNNRAFQNFVHLSVDDFRSDRAIELLMYQVRDMLGLPSEPGAVLENIHSPARRFGRTRTRKTTTKKTNRKTKTKAKKKKTQAKFGGGRMKIFQPNPFEQLIRDAGTNTLYFKFESLRGPGELSLDKEVGDICGYTIKYDNNNKTYNRNNEPISGLRNRLRLNFFIYSITPEDYDYSSDSD